MAPVRKRLFLELAAFLVVVTLVVVFAARWRGGSERHVDYRFMMGTIVSVTVLEQDAGRAADAIEEAFLEIARVESLTTRYSDTSEVSWLNAQAGGVVGRAVSRDVAVIAARSLAVARASGGAFDITVAPLVDLWGFADEEFSVPSADEVAALLGAVDWTAVGADTTTSTLSMRPGTAIDLDGVAKGYAVDRAARVLAERGIATGVVDAGGDVRFVGTPPDAEGWRVGVKHPRGEGLLGVAVLPGGSVATSGDYQRFAVVDGVRYHHLLDPSTGYPARGVMSVTVAAPLCVDADALATAVFVMGPGPGMELVESLDDVEAVIVTGDQGVGEVLVSSGMVWRPGTQ